MALNNIRLYLQLAVLCLSAPALCLPAAIRINTTCELGDCTKVDALPEGSSNGQRFSFFYVFPNTDKFRVYGLYAASDANDSTTILFNVRAYYVGNATNTASGNDLLNVDLLQGYEAPFNLDGTYSYSQSLHIGPYPAAASYVENNLFYEGQDVGQVGPLTGPGSLNGSSSADLTGLTNPLEADYRYTFYFAAGSMPIPPAGAESGAEAEGVGVTGSGSSKSKGDEHE